MKATKNNQNTSDRRRYALSGAKARRTGVKRRGTAMIEFAVALPLLFIIILGSVEMCNTIYLKQFLTEIAYQGALEATHPESTESDVTTSMRNLLDTRGVEGATILIQGLGGTAFDSVSPGERFEIAINISSTATTSGFSFRRFVDMSSRSVSVRQ